MSQPNLLGLGGIISIILCLVLMRNVNAYGCSESNSIRLTELNSSYAGYVQVCRNGIWTPVSFEGDEEWTKKNSIVTCRELGFLGSVRILNQDPSSSTSGSFYYSVECGGTEERLADCVWSIKMLDSHSQRRDAMVLCKKAPSDGEIALVGVSSFDNEGIVQIYSAEKEQWSLISSSKWDDIDAKVACRQLGFKGGLNTSFSTAVSKKPILLGGFRCSGSEKQLVECEHLDIDPYKSHYAGIVCETEAKGGTNLSYNVILLVAMIIITLVLILILLLVLKCTLNGFRIKPSSSQQNRDNNRTRNRQTRLMRTRLDSEVPYASLINVTIAPPSYEDTLQADQRVVQTSVSPNDHEGAGTRDVIEYERGGAGVEDQSQTNNDILV